MASKRAYETEPHLSGKSTVNLAAKGLVWLAWLGYVGYLLLSDLPPGPSLLHTQPETIKEALDLSLNFWLVLPALLPNVAPVLNPALEGLFNVVVAWGLLFFCFFIDGRRQKVPMLPFLIGTAFLTNVFYLPWLGLRQSQTEVADEPLTPLEKVAEGPLLPCILSGVFLMSLLWAGLVRPEFGGVADRWAELKYLVGTDRLAYSFTVDLLFFWAFQGWLVGDDMARRGWVNPTMAWVARLVPFFGLVAYFLSRPPLEVASQQQD